MPSAWYILCLRYRIPQVAKVELPSATNWRDLIFFRNSCFINVHIDDEKKLCLPGKLAYKRI